MQTIEQQREVTSMLIEKLIEAKSFTNLRSIRETLAYPMALGMTLHEEDKKMLEKIDLVLNPLKQ